MTARIAICNLAGKYWVWEGWAGKWHGPFAEYAAAEAYAAGLYAA